MRPPTTETSMCAVNAPAIVVVMSSYPISVTHRVSPAPTSSDSAHQPRYAMKSSFLGANSTVSNTQSFATNRAMAPAAMASTL